MSLSGGIAGGGLLQELHVVEAALLPEDSPRSPKEKPCGVQGVPVEERQGFVNAKLHRLVRGCIRAGGCWEEDVKPGDEPNICPLPA